MLTGVGNQPSGKACSSHAAARARVCQARERSTSACGLSYLSSSLSRKGQRLQVHGHVSLPQAGPNMPSLSCSGTTRTKDCDERCGIGPHIKADIVLKCLSNCLQGNRLSMAKPQQLHKSACQAGARRAACNKWCRQKDQAHLLHGVLHNLKWASCQMLRSNTRSSSQGREFTHATPLVRCLAMPAATVDRALRAATA